MIELLAPAGNREAFIAAVESGADAVYLAGKMFGARAYAANFSDEELAEAVAFAHIRGVKIYVTVNTLIDDSELNSMADYLRQLYDMGVDAIIVQDLGVARLALQVTPQLPLHASTQMTIHNGEGVEFLSKNGFQRVVLARELALTEIAAVCQNSNTEIEVFIHGALCICYSGQCLMSSMIGGRSGNRGRCAQPCRLSYTLVDKEGTPVLTKDEAGEFLLSPRDLNTLELLPQLIEAGVTSFKIEGRMKRPEYVAVVVNTYRRAIDACLAARQNYTVERQEQKNLAQVFNRDFTTAYLAGKQGRDMMSDRRPNNRGVRIGRVVRYEGQDKQAVIKLDEPLSVNDIIDFWVKVGGRVSITVNKMWVNGKPAERAEAGEEVVVFVPNPVRANDRVFKVFDAALMEQARGFFKEGAAVRRVPVDVFVEVAAGQPLCIRLKDRDGFCGEAKTQFIAEQARKRPLTPEVIRKQIERLGTTVFSLRHFDCRIESEVMVPVSEINDARRRAIEELEKARLAKFTRKPQPRIEVKPVTVSKREAISPIKPSLSVNVDSVEKLKVCLEQGADVILFGGESLAQRAFSETDYRQALEAVREKNKTIIFNTPRIIKQWQMQAFYAELGWFNRLRPDGIAVSNLGTIQMAMTRSDLPLHADYPLNIYNSATLQFFVDMGITSMTLSPELNFSQIGALAKRSDVSLECLAHGYLTLMVSEYCVLGSYLGQLHTGNCTGPCKNGEYWLKDRKNELFSVVTDQFCRMHIFNAKELSLLPHVERFKEMGIRQIRIEGKKTGLQELKTITRLYRELLDLGERHPLVQKDQLSGKEHENITRGHYFRGVL
jgi:putative protease